MNSSAIQVPARRLARWFIMSPAASKSLDDFWRHELGPGNMLAHRFDLGLIQPVDAVSIGPRLEALPRSTTGPVVLVFDRLSADDFVLVDGLPVVALQGLEIRLADWRSESLSIVAALASEKILDDSGLDAEEPEDDWCSMPLRLRRAASSGVDDGLIIECRPEGAANEELVFSRSLPLPDGSEMLMLEVVNPACIPRYVGCQVRVKLGGRRYDLGEIKADGVAHYVGPGPIAFDSSEASLLLRISSRTS